MNARDRALLDGVAALLDDPAHRGHPLHGALERLYHHHLEQRERLERLINIADGFQQSAQEDLYTTRHQLQRQLRRQHKLSRIADRFQDLLHERNQALEDVSTRDPLTGLANRRRLHQYLDLIVSGSECHADPLSLAMIDVDHFKRINDHYGHGAGDRVLVALARTLKSTLRANDLCGRWGGEEFLLVLPDTDLEQAAVLVRRLCERLRGLEFGLEVKRLVLTASAGIAEHHADENYQDTIRRADQALLTAKREGRDRWCLAG